MSEKSPHPNNERDLARKARRAFRDAYRETMEELGEAAVVEDGQVVIRRANGTRTVIADVPPRVQVVFTPDAAAE
jgi:hypothetical protein